MIKPIRTQSLQDEPEAGFRAAMTAKLREQSSFSDEDLVALASSNDQLFDEALEWATSTIKQEVSLTPTYLMISLAAGYAVKFSLDDHPEHTLWGKARALLPLLELMNAVPIDVYTLVCEVWFADRGSDDFRRGVRPSNCSDRQEGLVILVARPGARECRHYRTLRGGNDIAFEFVRPMAEPPTDPFLVSLFELLPNTRELKAIVYDEDATGKQNPLR